MSADMKTQKRMDTRCVGLYLGDAPVVREFHSPDAAVFLRLQGEPGACFPVRAAMVLQMRAETLPVSVGKRTMVYLRNLRMERATHAADRMTFCAQCGNVEWSTSDELRAYGWRMCHKCRAAVSVHKCLCWHAFGRCDMCSTEVVEVCPFDANQARVQGKAPLVRVDDGGETA